MLYYLILLIIIILIVDRSRPRKFMKVHQQLGTDWKYLPIIGQVSYFFGTSEDRYNAMKKLSQQHYKRQNGIVSLWLGLKFFVVIGDPIQAVAVLKSAFDQNFIHKIAYFFLGNGILFSPADIWQRRRKILVPTFATRNVSRFIQVFEANAKIVAEQLESKVGKESVSCSNEISFYGLDSVCETTLGVKLGSLYQPEHTFRRAFEEFVFVVTKRLSNPLLYMETLFQLSPSYRKVKHAKQIVYDFVDKIIHRKKKMISESDVKNKTNDGEPIKSFLELMIQSSEESDKGYTYEELREEVLALISAGTDTMRTGLGFTMLLLSQYQDIQDKVFKELDEVFGESRPINFENLHKLTYMEAVMKETMRLYPPIPMLTRDSEREVILPCGVKFPSRCNFMIDISSIHRNPKYWGSDAEYFKPERFLSGTPQAPGAFMAFGYGRRNCPGQIYAMLSMKTTLVTILRQYRLLPATSFKYDENNPLRISLEFMIQHVNNYDIQIQHRSKRD